MLAADSATSRARSGDPRWAYAPYAAFAAFGMFWGAWGAALPTLRVQAGVSEGQLGTALLFVGLGALPTMAVTGRAVDRVGLRAAALLLPALAGAGLLIAGTTDGWVMLVVGMLVVGATSGAADVAINALAGRAEHITAKPLLTRAHGLFSGGVVVASLATGQLLGAGLSLLVTFAVVAAVMVAFAVVVQTAELGPRDSLDGNSATPGAEETSSSSHAATSHRTRRNAEARRPRTPRLVVVGLVAALAYAVENAHQSWGAVMLTDVLNASPQLAAAAPATFAATTGVARLALAPLSRSHPTVMLVGGGALATAGSLVMGFAPSVTVALTGLVLAALGTATLFPTLLSRSLRSTDPDQHGRTTSKIAATAYLGFLLGPAYVGLLAAGTDLRGALAGVAALALVFTLAVTRVHEASPWERLEGPR